jgi:hypothetical protein
MEFNKEKVRAISNEIEAAVQVVAQAHGIVIKRGAASYTDSNFSLALKISTIGEGGVVQSQERLDFLSMAHFYGLKAEDIDQEFNYAGDRYKVVGLKRKSTKFPILVEKIATGKRFKFPEAAVIMGLKAKAAA